MFLAKLPVNREQNSLLMLPWQLQVQDHLPLWLSSCYCFSRPEGQDGELMSGKLEFWSSLTSPAAEVDRVGWKMAAITVLPYKVCACT